MRGKKNTTPEDFENAKRLKKESWQRWRDNNPGATAVIRRNRKAHYLRHKLEIQAKVEEWQKANPDKVAIHLKRSGKKQSRQKKQARHDAKVAKRKWEASIDGRVERESQLDLQNEKDRAKELADYKSKPVWRPGNHGGAQQKNA